MSQTKAQLVSGLSINASAPATSLNIDSSGRVLVGTSTARTNVVGTTPAIQLEGANDYGKRSMSIVYGQNDSASPIFFFAKHLSTSVCGQTAVQSGDVCGQVMFSCSDGTNFVRLGEIAAEVDGTPGTNDMPGRLVFSTTADGASSPTERMRIDQAGRVDIGGTSTPSGISLTLTGSSTSDNEGIFYARNTNITAAATVAAFQTATNSTATSNVVVRFLINGGSNSSGQINANGASAVAFGTWSDARLKENIIQLDSQWENIKNLRPVEFDYIESEGGGHQIGFIAQEVQTIYPDVVGDRGDGMLTLSGMSKQDARLIKALQEAQLRIETLEAEVAALKAS